MSKSHEVMFTLSSYDGEETRGRSSPRRLIAHHRQSFSNPQTCALREFVYAAGLPSRRNKQV